MRKIAREYENPIDNLIIDAVDMLCPAFKKLNFTPNGITTLSMIFGLLSIYFLYKGHPYLFGVTYFISYFFDCMDGHYARKYKMTSKFGDMYDHIKDVLVLVLLLGVLILKYRQCVSKLYVVIIFTLLWSTLMCWHLGCQEKIYDSDESATLSWTKKLCKDSSHIRVSRYFGCGTAIILFIMSVIWTESRIVCN